MIDFVAFPDVENANPDGLLTVGGDLSVDTLVSAYSQGIFPWFNDDQPVLWWSPDPRLVLYPEAIKVSRSLKKVIRKNELELRCNTEFEEVISGCALRGATADLEILEDTWITESMHEAYTQLHRQGYAHSIEVWQNNELVGGLYGIALGKTFFGESMFSRVSNASKIALVGLCQHLLVKGFTIIDCQVASPHLFTMGACEIERSKFIQSLEPLKLSKEGLHTEHLKHQNFSEGIDNVFKLFSK